MLITIVKTVFNFSQHILSNMQKTILYQIYSKNIKILSKVYYRFQGFLKIAVKIVVLIFQSQEFTVKIFCYK